MPRLRIATLQLNPRIPAVKDNIAKAEKILSLAFPKNESPDLLILPEMALCGYNYSSPAQVKPVLESVERPGPMLRWAEDISKKYGCFIVMGYPEWCSKQQQIFNSAVVLDKSGQVIHRYRKSFLYETDEVWGCVEGPGFKSFQLCDGVKASIGICMDLNPYQFKAPFTDFEFSSHCYEEGTNLIICPMNWLHGKSPSVQEGLTSDEKLALGAELQGALDEVDGEIVVNDKGSPIREYEENLAYQDLHEPDFHNLNYWLLRFFPFMNHARKPATFDGKTTVVYCNRSGLEDTILYGGSSSIVQFNGSKGFLGYNSIDLTNKSVDVLGALGKGDEGILIREVDI